MARIVSILGKKVGAGEPTYIIAEVGLNHNGDRGIALKLIDAAVQAGADAVKLQKRTATDILTKEAYDAPYNSENAYAPTYGAHREKLELTFDDYKYLSDYAKEKDIHLFASVWDPKSADFMESLDTPAYKIPSADLINLPLLEYVAKKGKPIIVSTGMSTMEEVEEAVQTILPHNDQLILLHCVSTYPCENEDVNLRVMQELQEKFDVVIGFSGHDRGVFVSSVAVGLGASVIEKHITLDRTMRGSDHSASLEPDGLRRVIRYIRGTEAAMGTGKKRILEGEIPMRHKLAKSVVTTSAILEGVVITREMLTVKSPGTGIKPKHIPDLVGRVCKVAIEEDSLVPEEALTWTKFS